MDRIRGIKGIEDTLIDYPGKPAAIVYFQGCDFRCPFCHNAGLVVREDGRDIPWSKLKDMLTQRINLIEALVVSGGEPTLNPGLEDLLGYAKELELATKLDTNGTRPEVIARLAAEGFLDYISMDVKHRLKQEPYSRAVGLKVGDKHCVLPRERQLAVFDIQVIKQSIKLIQSSSIDCEFRTTLVPGLHTRKDALEIARSLEGKGRYTLQNFCSRDEHIAPSYVGKDGFPEEELRAWAVECSEFIPTEVRGSKEVGK